MSNLDLAIWFGIVPFTFGFLAGIFNDRPELRTPIEHFGRALGQGIVAIILCSPFVALFVIAVSLAKIAYVMGG